MSVYMRQLEIQEIFTKFEEMVIPKNASKAQKSEMRMAFVSGMYASLVKNENLPILSRSDFIEACQAEVLEYTGHKVLDVYERTTK